MFISKDFKYLYISNPKTGTTTIRDIFLPYVYYIDDPHANERSGHVTQSLCFKILQKQQPKFDPEKIEKIFVFWRDPVERFLSALNFLVEPVFYNQISPIFQNTITSKTHPTDGQFNVISRYLNDILNPDLITPEFMLDIVLPKIYNTEDELNLIAQHFSKQTKWIIPSERVKVFNFNDYENGVRTMGDAFGVKIPDKLKRLNESISKYTSLEPSIESRVKEYYAKDYTLI